MEYSKIDVVLNTLSLVPEEHFSPVQIQKLFFLLDKRLKFNCFNFKPYHYGPYDQELTQLLTAFSVYGNELLIKNINGVAHYQINKDCIRENLPSFLDLEKRGFIKEMVKFVKGLSFKQLCMAIYKEFPEMAVNSVFFRK